MDNNKTITPRSGLALHRVGKNYMVVDAGNDNIDLVDVYTLNESAALLWDEASKGGRTIVQLAEALAEEYGISLARAIAAVTRQADEWLEMGMME